MKREIMKREIMKKKLSDLQCEIGKLKMMLMIIQESILVKWKKL